MDLWNQWMSQVASDPQVLASVIATGSLIAGVMVRVLLGRALLPLFRRTRSTLDDQAYNYLSNPISWTVVALGFSYAILSLNPSNLVLWGTRGILGSLTMIVWSVGFLKFTKAVVQERAARPAGQGLLNMRTGPVFDIGARIVVYAGCAYGLLVAWGIDPTAWLASAGIVGVACSEGSGGAAAGAAAEARKRGEAGERGRAHRPWHSPGWRVARAAHLGI